jgi:hypothetical protein
MEMSALLPLGAADRAICSSLVGPSIHRDLDRKAARRFLSNDANGAYRFTLGPLFNSLDALLPESLVTTKIQIAPCHGLATDRLGFDNALMSVTLSKADRTTGHRYAPDYLNEIAPLHAQSSRPRSRFQLRCQKHEPATSEMGQVQFALRKA